RPAGAHIRPIAPPAGGVFRDLAMRRFSRPRHAANSTACRCMDPARRRAPRLPLLVFDCRRVVVDEGDGPFLAGLLVGDGAVALATEADLEAGATIGRRKAGTSGAWRT